MGFLPWGGRSTAVRLRDGGVWVLASTPLNPETKETIDKLGPVKFIISPDSVHWLFIRDFKKAYPDAKVYACEEVIAKIDDPAFEFAGVWGRDPSETKYEFEDEIQACYFPGHKNHDIAFFHADSRTLIEADLLLNLPANEQYSKVPKGWLNLGGLIPQSARDWAKNQAVWKMGIDKEAMKRDAKTVSDWDFDRLIPCHGDVIETGAKKAWNDTYEAFLNYTPKSTTS